MDKIENMGTNETIETNEANEANEANETNDINETRKTTFTSLTPDFLKKNKQVYTEALDYAFSHDDIRNIAITGVYGAGKSTVWNTYREYKAKKLGESSFENIITVCLGKYKDNSKAIVGDNSTKDDPKNSKKNREGKELDNRVERQIINQISAQIKPSDIPLSNYKFKENIPGYGLWINIFLTLLFSASILFLVYLKYIFNYLKSLIGYTFAIVPLILIFIILFMGPSVYFLYHFYKKNKVRFSKVSFKVAEAEFTEDNNDETVLERDMKEIVYLLSSSNTNIVVFEDLDRYDSIEIFVKLKELNFLLNAYLKTNDNNKIVRFIYLIKDGLFYSKDRTKFFDFILPIVPVVNSKSSENYLVTLLKSTIDKPSNIPGDKIISNISLYIDDMRILRNIVNEYKVYSQIILISQIQLDKDKLFALVILKNIFPNEFDLLQEDKGYIRTLFNNLEMERDKENAGLKADLKKVSDSIHYLETRFEDNEYELMASFINPEWSIGENVVNQNWSEFLKQWASEPNKKYLVRQYNRSEYYDYNDFFNSFIAKNEERKKLIAQIPKDKKEKLSQLYLEKKSINDKIQNSSTNRYKEILELKTLDEINELFEIPNFIIIKDHYFPLIRYLIIDGLLDETYWYYKGYFDNDKQNVLKTNDVIFMKGLLEKTSLDVLFPVESPELIINRLNPSDYNRINILNYKILETCVEKELFKEVQSILETVAVNKLYVELIKVFNKVKFDTTFYCVDLMLKRENSIVKKVLDLCTDEDYVANSNIILAILNKNYKTTDDFKQLYEYQDYIENNKYNMQWDESISLGNFYMNLQVADLKFENLDKIKWPDNELSKLVNIEAYKPNVNNLIYLSNKYTGKEIKYGNLLSEIYENNKLPRIKEFLKKNFKDAITSYIKNAEDKKTFENSSTVFIDILNASISNKIKLKYIRNNITKIEDVTKIKSRKFLTVLLQNDLIIFKEENIQFCWNKLVETPIIDQNLKDSNIKTIVGYLNKKEKEKFIMRTLLSNNSAMCDVFLNNKEVNLKIFEYSLEFSEKGIMKLNPDQIPERIRILVSKNKVAPTEENLQLLIDKDHKEELKILVQNNEKEAVSYLTNIEIPNELIYDLIDVVSDESAKTLLQKLNETLKIDKISPQRVKLLEYIQNNNL